MIVSMTVRKARPGFFRVSLRTRARLRRVPEQMSQGCAQESAPHMRQPQARPAPAQTWRGSTTMGAAYAFSSLALSWSEEEGAPSSPCACHCADEISDRRSVSSPGQSEGTYKRTYITMQQCNGATARRVAVMSPLRPMQTHAATDATGSSDGLNL
jgi:hypothetical protein